MQISESKLEKTLLGLNLISKERLEELREKAEKKETAA